MARKLMVLMSVVLGVIAMGRAQITNIAQCINVVLTPPVLSEISLTDCSSPQRSFLGFIRGSVVGDYKSYLLHFTDSMRIEECGTSNLSAVTGEMTNDFLSTVQGFGFSNHVVRAYSESTTGLICYVAATLQSQKGLMIKNSYMNAEFVSTNGAWRISSWDVDE